MKKQITIFFLLISSVVFGQKKDTVKQDTIYILSKSEAGVLQSILRQNTITWNGKQLTFNEMLELIQMVTRRENYLPSKEQPKK